MVQEIAVFMWDDYAVVHDGTRVPATEMEVDLSFDGVACVLDLSSENHARLAELLAPWLKAGREPPRKKIGRPKTGPEVPAGPPAQELLDELSSKTDPPDVVPAPRVLSIPQKKLYFGGMREFAKRTGRPVNEKAKTIYYSTQLRVDFANHVLASAGEWPDFAIQLARAQSQLV